MTPNYNTFPHIITSNPNIEKGTIYINSNSLYKYSPNSQSQKPKINNGDDIVVKPYKLTDNGVDETVYNAICKILNRLFGNEDYFWLKKCEQYITYPESIEIEKYFIRYKKYYMEGKYITYMKHIIKIIGLQYRPSKPLKLNPNFEENKLKDTFEKFFKQYDMYKRGEIKEIDLGN